MKILHFGSLAAESGGPAYSLSVSVKGMRSLGHECGVLMEPLKRTESLLIEDATIFYTRRPIIPKFRWIPGMSVLLDQIGSQDLYHIQGLWQLGGHQMCAYAVRHGVPYVVTLRGMLYPQAMANKSGWGKSLALRFYQAADLRHAACIQATCYEEMDFYRKLGFRNPVAVIPNAVELDDLPEPPVRDRIFRIGYLGRLDSRKRIERLIYALSADEFPDKGVELLIIGSGDAAYEQFLHREMDRLGLRNVTFTGFLVGKEKWNALRTCTVLAVPSDFENFGNIVLDAMKQGIPVIASRGTPWRELEEFHCGWWVDNDVETLKETILGAMRLSPEELMQMGLNGQQLLKKRYEQLQVARRLEAMYQWVLRRGTPPDFLFEC